MQVLIADSDLQNCQRVELLLKEFLELKKNQIVIKTNRLDAIDFISTHDIDLLISEINLDGQSIYKVLNDERTRTFKTILMSHHLEMAYEAFNYDVLDFIAKPFKRERFKQAIDRYMNSNWSTSHSLQYLAIKNSSNLKVIKTDSINYLEGLRSYVKVHLKDGQYEIMNKSLENLEKMIPDKFKRIHRSYIVNSEVIESIKKKDNKSLCVLSNQTVLPISSSRYLEIINNFVK